MARHTLRGVVNHMDNKRLVVDDGILTEGHRITSFIVWPVDPVSTNDCIAVLAKEYDGTSILMRADDGRQIGWAGFGMDSTLDAGNSFSILDPDHIVIRDLYIMAQNLGADGRVNYLITLEPVSLTNDEAVLQLIKERSQDDPR